METPHRRYLEEEKRKALHAEVIRLLINPQSVLLKAAEVERLIEREVLVRMARKEGNFLN